MRRPGPLALAWLAAALGFAALLWWLVANAPTKALRRAASTTTVWAYYGGVGWATDEGIACESAVLVDQETGVMYLMTSAGGDVDVTVLLDADGTPRRQVE